MTVNTQLSIEIIYRLAESLNQIIRTSGEIRINNKDIWDNKLHKMDNHVWRGILQTLKELSLEHPELFKMHHLTAIDEGLRTLDKYEDYYDRVLDIKNKRLDNKKIAWKCLMTIREVYNASVGIYLPNDDSSKVKTQFTDLFEKVEK